jgi:Domain of unknown function (DUF2017)
VAKGFRSTRRGVSAKLDEGERALLAHLFVEVWELLGGEDGGAGGDLVAPGAGEVDPLEVMVGIGTATAEPADPALARLLPSAHREDDEVAAEFRRYTEQGLRARKRAGLETARRTLGRSGPLDLDRAEASAWVVALTDVRLVVGERLGLRTDDDAVALAAALEELDEDDPQAFLVAIYDFLTWLQESLVHALAR